MAVENSIVTSEIRHQICVTTHIIGHSVSILIHQVTYDRHLGSSHYSRHRVRSHIPIPFHKRKNLLFIFDLYIIYGEWPALNITYLPKYPS